MHRFYIPDTFEPGATVELPDGQARQVARVLRMHPGELIETFDGRGTAHLLELASVGPGGVLGFVRERSVMAWPFPWRVTLYLSLIRPQRFEWAIEKAAELGARAIVPMLAERCTHGDSSTGGRRLERWQQIAVEAAEQCGSAYVPDVRRACSFAEALSQPADARLFACEDPDSDRRPLIDCVPVIVACDGTIPDAAVFIGPEGGFTAAEMQAARSAGCLFVSLGPLTLRTETAVVAALAVLAQMASGRS